jgi:nucleotide-binding universal stress UspA family protein
MTRLRILVAVDATDTADRALEEAVALANARGPAELHLVTVLDLRGGVAGERHRAEDLSAALDDTAAILGRVLGAKLAAAPSPLGREAIHAFVHVRIGDPADEIVALARDLDADVVVTGTHGRRGLQRVRLGSVAERVVRLAPCAVYVVRAHEEHDAEDRRVEPPCPECVAERERTGRRTWWCGRHASPGEPAHTYGYSGPFEQERDAAGKLW